MRIPLQQVMSFHLRVTLLFKVYSPSITTKKKMRGKPPRFLLHLVSVLMKSCEVAVVQSETAAIISRR